MRKNRFAKAKISFDSDIFVRRLLSEMTDVRPDASATGRPATKAGR